MVHVYNALLELRCLIFATLNINPKPSDNHYLLLIALVFLLVLPKFLPTKVCSPSDVLYEQVLGKILLLLYMDVAR